MKGFLLGVCIMGVVWLSSQTYISWDRLRTIAHGEQEPLSLIHAIAEVESRNNRFAVGRDGEVGILQIREIMVEECNRILGREEFSLDDRWSVDRSVEMFKTYSDFWCARTKDYSDEGRARRWNGGPTGHTKNATEAYWNKVKAVLDR